MTTQQSAASSVSVSIGGGPQMNVPFTSGMNAQQALEAAYNSVNDPTQFIYALEYYGSGFGYLVMMINGTYDSFISPSHPYYFWEFYVNGAPASAGIDNTTLQAGDAISFELQIYTSKIAGASTLHTKYKARIQKQ